MVWKYYNPLQIGSHTVRLTREEHIFSFDVSEMEKPPLGGLWSRESVAYEILISLV